MKWIGYITNSKYNFNDKRQDYGIPSTYIVKKFSLSGYQKVQIRVAALGVYSLYLNGRLINDEFMSQDLSEYDKTIYYRDYNLTKFVHTGENELLIILSDGWYSSRLSIVGRNVFGEYPDKVAFEIFVDGKVCFTSDGSELASDGPIRACDNQNGIIIDNNYKVNDWHNVSVFEVKSKLKKSMIKPVKKEKAFSLKLVNQFSNHHIYDLGQNITGVIHLKVKGKKNSKIEIYHGEMLDDKNKLYTANLRSALAKCTYILNGEGEEEFLPRHTFFGFRYIDIIYDKDVEITFIKGIAFHSQLSRTGYIKTSNSLVNKIYKNILWGQKDNFLSIPTDCPQRDERMGWTGDAQIFFETASFNFDVHSFYKKYVYDMCDSMDLNKGRLPCFVPFFHKNSDILNDNPFDWCHDAQGWCDAIIIIPLNLYLYYGDKQVLKKALPYMKKYVKYVYKTRVVDGYYKGHSFGDWLSVFEETDKELYDNAYLARDNYLLSKVCEILGDKDKDKYLANFEKTRAVFREKYLLDSHRLSSDTQGAYVLAFSFGLIDENECKDNLIRKIKQYKHLTTGFHSTKHLLPTLCRLNEPSFAYKLLNNKKYPSWGYMVKMGATTIWERWDSYLKESGPNKDGMNSFNHYSLGSVGEWMYKDMVGISPMLEYPGFKKTLVKPYFNESVKHLKSSYKTINGIIKIDYRIEDKQIVYNIKGDSRIEFLFDFNNKIICKDQEGNSYSFILEK